VSADKSSGYNHKPAHDSERKPWHKPDYKPDYKPAHDSERKPWHKPAHDSDHKPWHKPDYKPPTTTPIPDRPSVATSDVTTTKPFTEPKSEPRPPMRDFTSKPYSVLDYDPDFVSLPEIPLPEGIPEKNPFEPKYKKMASKNDLVKLFDLVDFNEYKDKPSEPLDEVSISFKFIYKGVPHFIDNMGTRKLLHAEKSLIRNPALTHLTVPVAITLKNFKYPFDWTVYMVKQWNMAQSTPFNEQPPYVVYMSLYPTEEINGIDGIELKKVYVTKPMNPKKQELLKKLEDADDAVYMN
jgi:hypothetical protein